MATWLIPALKAVLPHIGTIISATAPAFTKKGAAPTTDQAHLLQQQISELQAAASQNATHVKELAEQLQRTVAAIEQAASVATSNQQRTLKLSLAAIALSTISICAVLVDVLFL
ncbi:MAG: hypothetical protein H6750_10150 [Nitrospiraceae bacterium]|nr:hypothetical protein [Nitrospiraceae bacterium]MCW5785457.1 hypothetical protein [Nitrospirales bacterium]